MPLLLMISSAFTCWQKQAEGKANTLRSHHPSGHLLCAFYNMPTDISTVVNQLTLVFTPLPNVFSLESVIVENVNSIESNCLSSDPSSTTSWLSDFQQFAYNAQCLSSLIWKMGMTTVINSHGDCENRIRWSYQVPVLQCLAFGKHSNIDYHLRAIMPN